MAVDLWQQAVWAQKQHHNQADLDAHIATALKKVQAVVRQMHKQQAAAAEQEGRAGSVETWPTVVPPAPRKPRSEVRKIEIQGPSQEAQVIHVQRLQRKEASLQPGAAPAAPASTQQQLQQQPVSPLQASNMAVAEAAQLAAEAESRPAQQPTQAAVDASQQQASQADAVVLPEAAIQAAVAAKVQAAMTQQMAQVNSTLQAVQEEAAESASRQMSNLRGELQQATQAHQELRSQLARQEGAIQQLQQTVKGQVSRQDEGSCAEDVVESSPGSLAKAAPFMPCPGFAWSMQSA